MNKLQKLRRLQEIAEEIRDCIDCKLGKSGTAVPGEGNPDADIIFIGEAPGRTESLSGRPFVGRSGKLLRQTIRNIGFLEREVFITSPVKYLPDSGTPSSEDIAHGRTHLIRQVEIINPKIVVLMGRVAAEGVLERKIFVSKMHGLTEKINGITYFFTFHPAAAIRFQKIRKLFEEDFKKLKNLRLIS